MSILEEFWYGNIHPCEQYIQKDSAYFGVLRKADGVKHQLLTVLSPEHQAIVDKLMDAQTEAATIAERDAFLMGFRTAVQMLMDSLRSSPESRI